MDCCRGPAGVAGEERGGAGEDAVLVDGFVGGRAVAEVVVDGGGGFGGPAGDVFAGGLGGRLFRGPLIGCGLCGSNWGADGNVGDGGVVPEEEVAFVGEERGDGDFAVFLEEAEGVAAVVHEALLVLAEAEEGFVGEGGGRIGGRVGEVGGGDGE